MKQWQQILVQALSMTGYMVVCFSWAVAISWSQNMPAMTANLVIIVLVLLHGIAARNQKLLFILIPVAMIWLWTAGDYGFWYRVVVILRQQCRP